MRLIRAILGELYKKIELGERRRGQEVQIEGRRYKWRKKARGEKEREGKRERRDRRKRG